MPRGPLFERELDTVVVGLPPLVVAGVGTIVALVNIYRLSRCKSVLDDKGDPARKKMSDTITALGDAISTGATAFLVKEYSYLCTVAACLFVLVSVVVDWRTGLW
jgi:Na+/H+-translocating membrane pyrophosphatase